MNVTLTSLLNTLLFSTISILLFNFAISRTEFFFKRGSKFLSITIGLLIVRLFLPFEIFSQQNIFITGIYHDIYRAIALTSFPFAGRNLTLLSVLIIVSSAGSLVCFIRLALRYGITAYALKHCQPFDSSEISGLIRQINSEAGRDKHFDIRSSPTAITPFIFGLYRPVIVLPKDGYSDTDLYYILSHEISHYYHGDLWIRFACELLLAIYWWNVPLYLLRKKLVEFQEIHIDRIVTESLSPLQQMEYLECLIKSAKMQHPPTNAGISAFGSQNTLSNRSRLILSTAFPHRHEKHQRIMSTFFTLTLILSVLILPNFIIIEPIGSIPSDIAETTIGLNPTNCYLVLNEKGKYDIYYNNEWVASVTQIFDESLPVYNLNGERIK